MKYIFFYFLLAAAVPASAQVSDSAKGEQRFTDFLNTMLHEKFMFDSPGPEFQLLEDSSGYQYLEKKATIKILITPGSFEELVTGYRTSFKWNHNILIDSAFFHSPRTGFRNVYEIFPPEGEQSENFIAIMVLFPFSENVVVGVIGAYPKSMDALYRKKYLDAALTLQHMD